MLLNLSESVNHIQKGRIIAFPTETVYGLGASVFDTQAIEKIFRVKGRPQDNPLIVHIHALSQIELICETPPNGFEKLAQAFFPGPLTVILPKKKSVPSIVSAGLGTIGVRMPSHHLARQLIEGVGVPLVAPSANLSGKPSSTTAQHVIDDFGDLIQGVLDGGSCTLGLESTVICLDPVPTIYRPGLITKEQLEQVLQTEVLEAKKQSSIQPLSPGMKYRHYAPNASVLLFNSKQQFESHILNTPRSKRMIIRTFESNDLYALLRRADAQGVEEILIYCNDTVQKNSALLDRLDRASQ
ncbi:MAG: Threonylcarbamoyl-AMP synthase [Chlamydiales bacterium]|nr:Threonylcarbamoyl-AMP synthase [Chlamydiales bacterium]